MREVKFRAWDKGHRCMWKNVYPTDKKNIILIKVNFVTKSFHNKDGAGIPYPEQLILHDIPEASLAISKSEEYIIMQYTGLKDKNRKEIYEGDIVRAKLNGSFIGVVVYDRGSFKIDDIKKENIYRRPYILLEQFAEKEMFSVEILGNIYENPNLEVKK